MKRYTNRDTILMVCEWSVFIQLRLHTETLCIVSSAVAAHVSKTFWAVQKSNPGPLVHETRTMPLDQQAASLICNNRSFGNSILMTFRAFFSFSYHSIFGNSNDKRAGEMALEI